MNSQLSACRIFMLCKDNTAYIRAMDHRDILAPEYPDHVAIFAAIWAKFTLGWHANPLHKTLIIDI